MTSTSADSAERIELRNKIGAIRLSDDPLDDNLAIALVNYFESFPAPEVDEKDDFGWLKHAVARTNSVLNEVTEVAAAWSRRSAASPMDKLHIRWEFEPDDHDAAPVREMDVYGSERDLKLLQARLDAYGPASPDLSVDEWVKDSERLANAARLEAWRRGKDGLVMLSEIVSPEYAKWLAHLRLRCAPGETSEETLRLARVALRESEGELLVTDWQAAAISVCKAVVALPAPAAQAEPAKAPMLTLNGYQLRDALKFCAPDGTDEQLEGEVSIQWGPGRTNESDSEPAGLYCWSSDYGEEGSIRLSDEADPSRVTPAAQIPADDAAGDSTEQALGLYADQADQLRAMLDQLAPDTKGNLVERVRQILSRSGAAPVAAVPGEAVAEIIECDKMGQQTVREIDGRWKFLPYGTMLYAVRPSGDEALLRPALEDGIYAADSMRMRCIRKSDHANVQYWDEILTRMKTVQAALRSRLAAQVVSPQPLSEEQRSDLYCASCVFMAPPFDKNPESKRIANLLVSLSGIGNGATPPAPSPAPQPSMPWPWATAADVLQEAIAHIEGQDRLKDALRTLAANWRAEPVKDEIADLKKAYELLFAENARLRARVEAGVPLTEEQIADIVSPLLRDFYACTRVWEAWHAGTMTEDDFEPAEDGELASVIAYEILRALSGIDTSTQPQGAKA